MMLMRVAMLVFLVLVVAVKTFLIWSPKRWPRRNRRWTGTEMDERAARNSNFSVLVVLVAHLRVLLLFYSFEQL